MALLEGTRVMANFGNNMTGTVIAVHRSGMVRVKWDHAAITDVWPVALDECPHEWDELLSNSERVPLPVRQAVITGYDIVVTFHVSEAQSEIDALARIGLTGTPGTPSPGLRSLMEPSGVNVAKIDGHRCMRPAASSEH